MDDVFEQVLVKKSSELHSRIGSLIGEISKIIHGNEIYNVNKIDRLKVIFSSLQSLINEFESSPKLLDQNLAYYVESLTDSYLSVYSIEEGMHNMKYLKTGIAEIVYFLSKIRGFKFITNYFSSDVYLVPKLLNLTENTSLSENETFLILIWLSNLVLVPFCLSLIKDDLPYTLLEFGLKNLEKHSNASKNQSVSLILLSRLISRQDSIQNRMLSVYFNDKITSIWTSSSNSGSIKLGHMMTINKLMKRCSFEVMTEYLGLIHKKVIMIDLINLRTQEETHSNDLNNLNVLYIIKIMSKLMNSYLQLSGHCKFQHVSNIVNNLFHEIMYIMTDNFDTNLRYAMAKNLSTLCGQLSIYAINYQEQLILYLIEQLDITNIRISFSPYEQSCNTFNLFQTDLDIHSENISIPKYHTILLFFAYVSLKKSLPTHLILPILSIVHKTLFIQQKRVTSVLGTQLRDSSCFILWSLCRIIKLNVFNALQRENKNMMEIILFDLMKVAIFDSDLTIRRCGVAVIQEFIGRFGSNLFGSKFINNVNCGEKMGLFIIKLIEIFNNQSLGSLDLSYSIIHELTRIGFKQDLFIPCLLENIHDDDIKFDLKKLNTHHLAKIFQTSAPGEYEFEFLGSLQKSYTLQNILLMLGTDVLTTGKSLYAFAEIATISSTISNQYIPMIKNNLKQNFIFDHHHDSNEKAEGFVKWINCCLIINSADIDFDIVWKELFHIARSKYTIGITEEFKLFFRHISEMREVLSPEHFLTIVRLIKNNNIIIAKSVLYYQNYSTTDKMTLINLIQDKTIDCETRSSMIESMNDNIEGLMLDSAMLSNLINLLDDYTITNQGDVGSKVRLYTVYLIKNNIPTFRCEIDIIELKLIRISGELIDKLRFESIKLIYAMRAKRCVDIDNTSNYQFLFKYYKTEILSKKKDSSSNNIDELSINFWKGIVFSLGAFTATSSIINQSFIQFLVFMESLNQEEHGFVFSQFLKLLKIPPDTSLNTMNSRELKLYTMTLNVFVKLFESNASFPAEFDYQALFVRCYNLHINTSNLLRIGTILKIFLFMGTLQLQPDVKLKARSRVCWLCCHHPLPRVRSMSSEILFEILNELSPDNECISALDSIDWEESPRKLKLHFSRFQQTFTNL